MDDNNNNSNKQKKTLSLDELLAMESIENFDPFYIPNDSRTGGMLEKKSTNKGVFGTNGKTPTLLEKHIQKEELREVKKENKFYLPVLSLNDETMWQTKPMSERTYFTDEVAKETCLTNCCNAPGVFSACCRLDPNDLEHILGPVTEKWIKRFLNHSQKKGLNYKRSDVVIDFEEGKLIGDAFFNGHPIFSKPTSYPMMRIQAMGPRFGCKFLNPDNGMCGIYPVRPDMCSGYLCQYVKKSFLVKTKSHPNTYKRVDVGRNDKENE